MLVTWGYVEAYRHSGGVGYPASLATGKAGGASLYNMPDLGTSHASVEMALKGTAPIVRGLLWHQYVRPIVTLTPEENEQEAERTLRKIKQDAKQDVEAEVAAVEEMARPDTLHDLERAVSSVERFVETVYGDLLPHQAKAVVKVIDSIRARWIRSALETIFPRLEE